MGTKKTYPAGYCLNKGLLKKKKRTMTINTIPDGKLHIPGINSNAFGTIQNMRGLVPGVLNDMYDITPLELWKNVQGKGKAVKDCFTDYSNLKSKIKQKKNHNNYSYLLIIFISIIYLFYILRYLV